MSADEGKEGARKELGQECRGGVKEKRVKMMLIPSSAYPLSGRRKRIGKDLGAMPIIERL